MTDSRDISALHRAEQAEALDQEVSVEHAQWIAMHGWDGIDPFSTTDLAWLERFKAIHGEAPRATCEHGLNLAVLWWTPRLPYQLTCRACFDAAQSDLDTCDLCETNTADGWRDIGLPASRTDLGFPPWGSIHLYLRACPECRGERSPAEDAETM